MCAYRQYLFQTTAHKFISDVQPEVQLIGRRYQCIDELHACHLQCERHTEQKAGTGGEKERKAREET